MNRPRSWTLAALVLLAAASRLVPHPDNVTPTAAIALFAAATFHRRLAAALVPLLALLLSDGLLQLTYRAGWQPNWGFYRGQWVVYACTLATVGLGFLLRSRRTVATVAATTLASSVLFYLATNFGFFYGTSSLYPQTPAGLLTCYVAAIPFFRNSLLGDFGYVTLLFGALALAEARFPALRRPAFA